MESIYDQMTKSEKLVADLLKELGIKWSYEQPIFVWDENKKPRVWAPVKSVVLKKQIILMEYVMFANSQ